MKSKSKSIQLNCFSPPVMIATFTIEIVLAAYVIWRYKMNILARLVTASLIALAVFQFAEYHTCGALGMRSAEWSRVGFVAITLLPALGLHILYVLADKSGRRLVSVAYLTMAVCIAYFLLNPQAFTSHECTGNYVIFRMAQWAAIIHGNYYFGWLLIAIGLGVAWAIQLKAAGAKSRKRVLAVQSLIAGYLVFLIPTAIAYAVSPEARGGIPSIMCGFAVLFALILALRIMPLLGKRR